MNKTPCFSPAHILLPSEQIPVGQWGCVACDQFTSDRSYWGKGCAGRRRGPSTLDLILPEVYLEEDDVDARISAIHAAMDDYTRNVLTRAVDGFIYVERTEQSGRVRQGLVGRIDLEAYSYAEGAVPAIRPSEHTVESRIPPRMAVRRGARLETPHIMMLADDPGCTLIEPIGEKKGAAAQGLRGRPDAERRPHCRLGSGRSRPAGPDRQRPERSGQPGRPLMPGIPRQRAARP